MTNQVETKQVTWQEMEVVEEQPADWVLKDCDCPCTPEQRYDFELNLTAETIARVWDVNPEDIKEECSPEMSLAEMAEQLGINAHAIWELRRQNPQPAVRGGVLLLTGITSEEFQKAFEKYYLEEASKGNVFTYIPIISNNPSDVSFSIPEENMEDVRNLAEGEPKVEFHTYTSMRFGAPLCTAHRAPISGRWNLP